MFGIPAEIDEGRLELSVTKVLWLYFVLASASLVFWYPPGPVTALVAATLTALTLCAGHSVGLHRGLIHRTYRAPRWLLGGLAYLFVHTGIGGPIAWIRLHYVRDYYQNERSCPRYFAYDHSLARDYLWSLHLRFVPSDPDRYGVPPEHERNPWLTFLEKTWAAHVVLLAVLLWICFGLEVSIACVPVRVAVSVLGHWFVGFRAHQRGEIRYDLEGSAEAGRNLPWLGVLSFGEGFHNNHHANPGSARMGEARGELDLGWYLLLVFEKFGLVSELASSDRVTTLRQNARALAASEAPLAADARHGAAVRRRFAARLERHARRRAKDPGSARRDGQEA